MAKSYLLRMAALLLATGLTGPALAQSGETLRIAVDVDGASFDTRTQRNTTDMRVLNLIYNGLVRLDVDLQPQPDLATSWEMVDPTTIVFTLRDDATFHDGEPVTAQDVIFTFETLIADTGARLRSLYEPIESIEDLGGNQVQFNLRFPYAPLFSYLDLGIVPKHAVEAGIDLATQPIGSGPYEFVRWDRGSQIVVAANDEYFGGEPALDEVTFVLVPDATARAQALESGDIDVVLTPIAPQDIGRLMSDDRFNVIERPGVSINYLNFNSSSDVLTDPTVRRAIGMLVDQASIVQQIYGGIDQPATSILMPVFDWVYTDEVRQAGFDPEAALALLAEAGWEPGQDGILQKDGERLSITLSTHSEDSARVQSVEFLQNLFSAFGIAADVYIAEYAAFIQEVYAGNYDIALLGWTTVADPDRILFAQFTDGGSANWGGYSNAETAQYINEGRSAATLEERAEAYHKAAALLAEEVPYYVLSYVQSYAVVAKSAPEVDFDARGYLLTLTE